MRVMRHPDPAYDAALAAFREVLPQMSEKEAKAEVMRAVAHAAA
jgi:hypothetical protein